MKRFCSVDYVDAEGERTVRHAFLTQEEIEILRQEMADNGVEGSVNDLTPPQAVAADEPAVLSGDERPRLEQGS